MRSIIRVISETTAAWYRFWFSVEDPLPLCVLRILVGGMLFYTHLIWCLDLKGFFGASGWNNVGILSTLQQDTLSWSLWWLVPEGYEFQFHVACLSVLFLFWIGCATRVTSVLAWVITVSYAHRTMLANFGLDQINAMLAFYLMLAPCGTRLSIDSWWRSRKGKLPPAPSAAANLSLRLIQVHICVIYFWAGLSKLQGTSWWTGEALWQMIANHEYQSLDLTWLANYPSVLQLATHGVILFEITFPIFVFHRRLRPVVMLAGTMLHLGIGAFFGMWTFGLIMIFGYVSFLDAASIRRVANRLTFLFQPRQAADMAYPVSTVIAKEKASLTAAVVPIPSPPPLKAFSTTETLVPNDEARETSRLAEDVSSSTVKFKCPPTSFETPSIPDHRRRYVADALFYVARSPQQRANVRAYFRRHKLPCKVLRGAAELVELTVNLRKATIVLRAKDFSLPELQFWCDELAQTNPDGLFRVFILPNTKQEGSTAGLELNPRIHLFRLSATTTLRRIRKLYLNQHWDVPAFDEEAPAETKRKSGTKIIRAAGLMCLLMAVFLSTGCGTKQNSPKVQLERARMMLERGQLHESVQAFSTAFTKVNPSADDYYDRGVAYEQLEQLDQAVADYTEALRLEPTHAQALNNRAVVLAQLGRVGEALNDLSHAIEVNPQDALAWGNRGLARHESGSFAEAIADYTQALKLSTAEPRLYFQRGNVYVDAEQPEPAVADFSAALKLDSTFVRAHLNRANALVQLGKIDEAVSDLQTVSEMDHELSMAGAIEQLQRQVRSERWEETAVAGLQAWLKTQDFEIQPTSEDSISKYGMRRLSDEDAKIVSCVIASTGPRGAPVIDATMTQKLIAYDDSVALFVIDKQALARSQPTTSTEQPSWLKDWRFEWRPQLSDFMPSRVEVLLAPAAD